MNNIFSKKDNILNNNFFALLAKIDMKNKTNTRLL